MAETETTKPETGAIEPYRLGEFATGGKINFITQGNVSIPLSISLLRGIVPVKKGDRGPTITEMVMFVNAVIEQKCNCYLNECWLVLIRDKYVPIIAAQKRIAKAQSIPSYDGYEWGWIDKDGNRCPAGPENKVVQANIIGVWGRIYFKDRTLPFYHEIFRSEYKHERNDRPITMLLKTARDQVHKYAFANEMGNLCTENEIYDERLPAPESDVLPRDERRSLAVPSSTIDTTRAPVKEETETEEEKPESELVTFKCNKCGRTYRYGKEAGKGVKCECGKGVLVLESAEPVSDEDKKSEDAGEPSIEEKGDKAASYVEVKEMYAAQNGQDFAEFAAYVLCLDESEVDAPSKLTEEMLKTIKAYIETNGVAIN